MKRSLLICMYDSIFFSSKKIELDIHIQSGNWVDMRFVLNNAGIINCQKSACKNRASWTKSTLIVPDDVAASDFVFYTCCIQRNLFYFAIYIYSYTLAALSRRATVASSILILNAYFFERRSIIVKAVYINSGSYFVGHESSSRGFRLEGSKFPYHN
jgi:hypothetical protein